VVSPRVKGYAIVAAVFLAGTVAGGAAATAWVEQRYADLLSDDRREQRELRRLRALSRELELSSEQEDEVRSIMQAHRAERRRLTRDMFERCGELVRKHKDTTDTKIRAVLDPKQQKRFDELAALHRERFLYGSPGGKGRVGDAP
jgi:Spy/CpxP family protein refolding chaperone